MITIIDTFRDYIRLIEKQQPQTVEERMVVWETYISNYPELEKKFKEDYTNDDIDWREFGLTKVFNHQAADYDKMLKAYEHIESATEAIIKRIETFYGLDFDINIVYYSGLCNSAGWVDSYQNTLSILLGIDKIAELGWHELHNIETLIAHEFCHALHFNYRKINLVDPAFDKTKYDDGIWYLYEEGIATHFQKSLTDHDEDTRGHAWTLECQSKIKLLKTAYKEALKDTEIGTRNFYGDWYKVHGLSDVAYFLGSVMVSHLNQTMSLEEISKLKKEAIEKIVLEFLE